jgi:hypothetical protein
MGRRFHRDGPLLHMNLLQCIFVNWATACRPDCLFQNRNWTWPKNGQTAVPHDHRFKVETSCRCSNFFHDTVSWKGPCFNRDKTDFRQLVYTALDGIAIAMQSSGNNSDLTVRFFGHRLTGI